MGDVYSFIICVVSITYKQMFLAEDTYFFNQ